MGRCSFVFLELSVDEDTGHGEGDGHLLALALVGQLGHDLALAGLLGVVAAGAVLLHASERDGLLLLALGAGDLGALGDGGAGDADLVGLLQDDVLVDHGVLDGDGVGLVGLGNLGGFVDLGVLALGVLLLELALDLSLEGLALAGGLLGAVASDEEFLLGVDALRGAGDDRGLAFDGGGAAETAELGGLGESLVGDLDLGAIIEDVEVGGADDGNIVGGVVDGGEDLAVLTVELASLSLVDADGLAFPEDVKLLVGGAGGGAKDQFGGFDVGLDDVLVGVLLGLADLNLEARLFGAVGGQKVEATVLEVGGGGLVVEVADVVALDLALGSEAGLNDGLVGGELAVEEVLDGQDVADEGGDADVSEDNGFGGGDDLDIHNISLGVEANLEVVVGVGLNVDGLGEGGVGAKDAGDGGVSLGIQIGRAHV